MQFKAAALLATMLALAQAMPTSKGALHKRDDYCGASSFNGATSGASPLVSDCLQMIANIAGDGTWTAPGANWRTLTTYGTCAFGAQAASQSIFDASTVGNQDIIDLVNSSIGMFQSNGLVGAGGNMGCDGDSTNWGLYHT